MRTEKVRGRSMRQQTASTMKTAVLFGIVVIVLVWLGRGVLTDWLKALHGVH